MEISRFSMNETVDCQLDNSPAKTKWTQDVSEGRKRLGYRESLMVGNCYRGSELPDERQLVAHPLSRAERIDRNFQFRFDTAAIQESDGVIRQGSYSSVRLREAK